MQINLINQSYGEEKTEFVSESLLRRWDILLMVVDGVYSILPEGSKKPILLQKNDIAFIPAGTSISRKVIVPPTYYHISFHAQADHPFRFSLPVGKLSLPPEQTVSIFNSMKLAYPIPDNHELITHIIEHILAENYLFGKTKKVKFHHLSREVSDTVRYMNRNLDKQLSIDELAARVYLSHSGLIWKFRQELGTTPSQYLILLRLRYAKQLLLNHPYSISEISSLCGYSNPFYFTNAFRQYSGMSPSEFRKYYLDGAK